MLTLERSLVEQKLAGIGLSDSEISEVSLGLCTDSVGVMLYGSRARGDYTGTSDFDLLRLSSNRLVRATKVGRISITSYTIEQFESASGTLFGTHLKRDGRVLVDPEGTLAQMLARFDEVDPIELLNRVTRFAVILDQNEAERETHLDGMVELARYLLRTAIYSIAIREGAPCFSVRELATRYSDPDLARVLASDRDVTGAATEIELANLVGRLSRVIGGIPRNTIGNIEVIAVATRYSDPYLSALAARAASRSAGAGVDYSDLPGIVL